MENTLEIQLTQATMVMKERLGDRTPEVAIVLGSGLNPLADEIQDPVFIPFSDVPHMGLSTVQGHIGRFVCGTLEGKTVIVMQGRLHGYEGYSTTQVAFPIWLMASLGARVLFNTNAAGSINEFYHPGDFCVVVDHINFTGRNPIANAEAAGLADRFFSMTDCYDPVLRNIAINVAHENSVHLHEGVYVGLLGPSFETPAEIRMFRSWGADTVAMSMCEEVIAARHVGMRVLGINLISNVAAGIGAVEGVGGHSPSEGEIAVVARTRETQFSKLIHGVLAQI